MDGSSGHNKSAEAVRRIKGLLDQRVLGLRRIQFHHRGSVDESAGPLELTTATTGSVVFDAGPDGELLDVKAGAWRDPFEGKTDEATRQFNEEHGRWVARDLSRMRPWQEIIGQAVDDVEVSFAEYEQPKVVAALLRVGHREIKIAAVADELIVNLSTRAD